MLPQSMRKPRTIKIGSWQFEFKLQKLKPNGALDLVW
jgi:hypothetical protein